MPDSLEILTLPGIELEYIWLNVENHNHNTSIIKNVIANK